MVYSTSVSLCSSVQLNPRDSTTIDCLRQCFVPPGEPHDKLTKLQTLQTQIKNLEKQYQDKVHRSSLSSTKLQKGIGSGSQVNQGKSKFFEESTKKVNSLINEINALRRGEMFAHPDTNKNIIGPPNSEFEAEIKFITLVDKSHKIFNHRIENVAFLAEKITELLAEDNKQPDETQYQALQALMQAVKYGMESCQSLYPNDDSAGPILAIMSAVIGVAAFLTLPAMMGWLFTAAGVLTGAMLICGSNPENTFKAELVQCERSVLTLAENVEESLSDLFR